jgi:hypothetical protein
MAVAAFTLLRTTVPLLKSLLGFVLSADMLYECQQKLEGVGFNRGMFRLTEEERIRRSPGKRNEVLVVRPPFQR